MSDGLQVGTYLAEQVALTCYALLSASHADSPKRVSFHPRRRRDGRVLKTTLELPALSSLDPCSPATRRR